VVVPSDVYAELFSKEFERQLLSPYAIAFIGASQWNIKLARANGYPERLAYLMDTGNPYADQIQKGHALQSAIEKLVNAPFTGRLTFENDANNTALQAADVIAWSARRRSAEGLLNEFAPLEGIFTERFSGDGSLVSPHYKYEVSRDALEQLRSHIDSPDGNRMPTAAEIMDSAHKTTVSRYATWSVPE